MNPENQQPEYSFEPVDPSIDPDLIKVIGLDGTIKRFATAEEARAYGYRPGAEVPGATHLPDSEGIIDTSSIPALSQAENAALSSPNTAATTNPEEIVRYEGLLDKRGSKRVYGVTEEGKKKQVKGDDEFLRAEGIDPEKHHQELAEHKSETELIGQPVFIKSDNMQKWLGWEYAGKSGASDDASGEETLLVTRRVPEDPTRTQTLEVARSQIAFPGDSREEPKTAEKIDHNIEFPEISLVNDLVKSRAVYNRLHEAHDTTESGGERYALALSQLVEEIDNTAEQRKYSERQERYFRRHIMKLLKQPEQPEQKLTTDELFDPLNLRRLRYMIAKDCRSANANIEMANIIASTRVSRYLMSQKGEKLSDKEITELLNTINLSDSSFSRLFGEPPETEPQKVRLAELDPLSDLIRTRNRMNRLGLSEEEAKKDVEDGVTEPEEQVGIHKMPKHRIRNRSQATWNFVSSKDQYHRPIDWARRTVGSTALAGAAGVLGVELQPKNWRDLYVQGLPQN